MSLVPEEYIYFNTDFIYEFGKDYIIDFGGEEDNIIDAGVVIWNQIDIPIILSTLETIEDSFEKIRYEDFEKNKDGTVKLQNYLLSVGVSKKYLFGCLIYQQLQYQCPLKANYLSGEPNLDL